MKTCNKALLCGKKVLCSMAAKGNRCLTHDLDVPKGTNSMAMSWPGFRKRLFGSGWAVSYPPTTIYINGLRKQSSHLVGSPFQAVKLFPSLSSDYLKLMDEYGLRHECVEDDCKALCEVWGLKTGAINA